MMNIFVDVLQFIGGLSLAIKGLPQVIKIIKTKRARDLSTGTMLYLVFGLVAMQIYAIYYGLVSLAITNGLSILLDVSALFLKFYYDKKYP